MRKHLLSTAAVLAVSLPLFAQQQQQPTFLLVHQELVKPSMVAQYEAATKEFIAMVKAHRDKIPTFNFRTYASPDLTYAYVFTMPNLATLDTVNAEFGALGQAAGAAYLDLNKRGGAATEYWREALFQLTPELSYRPAQPRLKPDEVQYIHYSFYYVMPGREPAADELCTDYAKLYKNKNISSGWTLYKAVNGAELPLYVVTTGARDAADFVAEDAKIRTALGAEGQALAARAMGLTRRYEERTAVPRPDLSLSR